MTKEKSIKSILIDLDGTVYVGEELMPGVAACLENLQSRGYKYRFLTNTTTRSRRMVAEKLRKFGIIVPAEHIITPASCVYQDLSNRNLTKGILPLVDKTLLEDLPGLPQATTAAADIVLVGDMGKAWQPEVLDLALQALLNGAELKALHLGRFSMTIAGPKVDVGAYVAALEYSSGVGCSTCYGKPNPKFFHLALQAIGSNAGETVMVGDDLISDVLAAKAVGITGIQVKTGKFPAAGWHDRLKEADGVLENLGDLPAWLP